MSRHNRRRTRAPKPSPLHSDHHHQHHYFQNPPAITTTTFSLAPILISPSPTPPNNTRHPRRTDISARHWHNRYLAWQLRERRQREEKETLDEEQRRIFGGDGAEAGDEGAREEARWLCGRMMDFFRGLEFLEG